MATNNHSWQKNSPFEAGKFSQHDWRTSTEKLLGDTGFDDALVTDTFDGIEVQPLYTQHADAPFYSRGSSEWEICQAYCSDNTEHTNQQILSDLNEGVGTIELMLTSQNATSACDKVTDLERLLKGVHPKMIRLSLTPSTDNTLYGPLLLAYYYRQKIATEDVNCALNIDPIGLQARTGLSANSQLDQINTIAEHCCNHYSNVSSLCADSSVYHNAGSTEAQEIAFLLATTVDYLRALKSIDVESAFKQLRFRLALDSDYFQSIAKLRAARELLNQVATGCGASSAQIFIDTITGTRSMTALDMSVNILRTSTQAAAAMAGGASGYLCEAYDSLTDNSVTARRLARNTHHILKEESGLLNVNDPARGSGYIESLTASLCSSAWDLFQKIESNGGMQQSLQSGFIHQQIKKARSKREQAVATVSQAVIGVSQYPDIKEKVITTKHVTNQNPPNESTSTPPSITAFVGALADGDSISNFQTETTGKRASQPVTPYRDSMVYEQLRYRSSAWLEANNNRPKVSLLTIGSKKDYAQRVAFCKDFFATAGIEITVTSFEDNAPPAMPLAIICSSDDHYISNAQLIKWIAGNNPKVLSLLKENITAIHLRCDRPALLDQALSLMGAQ